MTGGNGVAIRSDRAARAARAARTILVAAIVAGLVLAAHSAAAQTAPGPNTPPTTTSKAPTARSTMSATIKGPFEVKMTPQGTATDPVGRFTLDKAYHGDLEATALGEMLAFGTEVKGSAGYVAIEKVTGTLTGRSGTFALQHWGVMDKGTPELRIMVVPDSGTGDLTGLTGTMTIDIQPGGKHFYGFTYTLPPSMK
jgi:hypothetical protein